MNDYSVLMSVYCKENPAYLETSILSMLNQTVPPSDFVLVCDGPLTDELNEVIAKLALEYSDVLNVVRLEKNSGLGIALNHGLPRCKYSIIARMDSDDIAMPFRCEKQLHAMNEKKVDIISGTVMEFESDPSSPFSKRVLPTEHDDIIKFARRRNPFNHPCVMFRKEIVMAVGGYQHFDRFEDYFLWMRMLANGAKGCNIAEPLLLMRSGPDLYLRRSGFAYCKSIIKFRWYMKKEHLCGWSDFVVTLLGHSMISLVPNFARRYFYNYVLREKNGE